MKLIDKAAVVAEIEKLTDKVCDRFSTETSAGVIVLSEYILSFINTLEVKDECIENDFDSFWGDYIDSGGDMNNYEVAKHFFELGLSVSNKAQKGE